MIDNLKRDFKENLYANWKANRFGFRIALSALLGMATIAAVVGSAFAIANYTWLLSVLVFAVFAAAVAVKWHEVIDKRVNK
jgi:hypothetical protein